MIHHSPDSLDETVTLSTSAQHDEIQVADSLGILSAFSLGREEQHVLDAVQMGKQRAAPLLRASNYAPIPAVTRSDPNMLTCAPPPK